MPMVKFTPTDQQREDVAALASAGTMTLEQIAKTIINPRTQRPVSVKTLTRIFRQQLAEDHQIQAQALKNLRELVDAKDWAATKYCLDNIIGLKEKAATAPESLKTEIKNITVSIPYRGQWVERPDGSTVWEGGPGPQIPEPKLIEHQPVLPKATLGEPAPGETIRARTISEPALLPEWQRENELLKAPRPVEPAIPEPLRPSDLPQPSSKMKREALAERARLEGCRPQFCR